VQELSDQTAPPVLRTSWVVDRAPSRVVPIAALFDFEIFTDLLGQVPNSRKNLRRVAIEDPVLSVLVARMGA
jgi:hypothetical protein